MMIKTSAGARFFKLGLVGFPLGHSLSPALHAAALQACGLGGYYSLFPIPPEDGSGLAALLARVRSGKLDGLNVTIPHKLDLAPHLDELTPVAKAIGAVNTVYSRKNRLVGDNTDAPGFLSDLANSIAGGVSGSGRSALILGAGGSARAVAYALHSQGWTLSLASRRIEQARELASALKIGNMRILALEDLNPEGYQLIVNATPVGMKPEVDQSPWPEKLPFPPQALVYDLVYNPRETRMVREARAQGLQATTGLGMLIEQAILSFEKWTGQRPPREALRNAVNATRSTDPTKPRR